MDEIESIVAYGEAWSADVPVYVNRVIQKPYDAQFSFAHAVSVAAHGVRPGKDWQDPDVVFSESVLGLMSRIEWRAAPLMGRGRQWRPAGPAGASGGDRAWPDLRRRPVLPQGQLLS